MQFFGGKRTIRYSYLFFGLDIITVPATAIFTLPEEIKFCEELCCIEWEGVNTELLDPASPPVYTNTNKHKSDSKIVSQFRTHVRCDLQNLYVLDLHNTFAYTWFSLSRFPPLQSAFSLGRLLGTIFRRILIGDLPVG